MAYCGYVPKSTKLLSRRIHCMNCVYLSMKANLTVKRYLKLISASTLLVLLSLVSTPSIAAIPSGVGNNVVSTAVNKFATAALHKYYSNSSDQYEFSTVDNIVHHKDGRITGDMVMKYKNSDLSVRLGITLDDKYLTIRNAWGHVMGVYPLTSESEETPE